MSCPHVCRPLHMVVNADGKKHPVVDFHCQNQFLQIPKFKYEGLDFVPQIFSKGDFFFTFDLKSMMISMMISMRIVERIWALVKEVLAGYKQVLACRP